MRSLGLTSHNADELSGNGRVVECKNSWLFFVWAIRCSTDRACYFTKSRNLLHTDLVGNHNDSNLNWDFSVCMWRLIVAPLFHVFASEAEEQTAGTTEDSSKTVSQLQQIVATVNVVLCVLMHRAIASATTDDKITGGTTGGILITTTASQWDDASTDSAQMSAQTQM